MTKIVDLMRGIIAIFDEHAGEDKMLSKEELMRMMGEEQHEMFASEEVATKLMSELDENLDGQISFDEFIKSMAFICALVKYGQEDASDFIGRWLRKRFNRDDWRRTWEIMTS
ncbi:Oidioi.mRNA.OKI2018_I69.PAR.g8726.t1.cds [Oikopleura dioica]|uniref:Oidioi.mRNA.OKI2018_I69.PAR.g8726.t1.cds n=1 Tax=Oikopleura dioica TaxID=34765 RepID=A0ABN7RLT8_OIKDI|nr:Oidioi.mRNA.OKI2018_I69.PAR.g8726.t1.cds [Oikopleura dioica]